jgi:NAD(P)-dependent dehydrogenase (short-subunit alcohol dehydrogenase family)
MNGANLFSLADKTVVLTGGTGKLGQRYSDALCKQGAKVAVLDLGPSKQPNTDNYISLKVDITKRQELERALTEIKTKWGIPYGLINNAAIDFPPAKSATAEPFESYPEDKWDRTFDVNVKGTFLCCQVFGGAMADAGQGSIVNIGSIYGLVSPDQKIYDNFVKPAAYGASKAALLNLTRYLATYWGGTVRVNMLSLGGVEGGQSPSFIKKYSERVPMGRMAREDEYSGAVIFLLSNAASYMTGSNLVIDGGCTAW